jgi:hypothetical protein
MLHLRRGAPFENAGPRFLRRGRAKELPRGEGRRDIGSSRRRRNLSNTKSLSWLCASRLCASPTFLTLDLTKHSFFAALGFLGDPRVSGLPASRLTQTCVVGMSVFRNYGSRSKDKGTRTQSIASLTRLTSQYDVLVPSRAICRDIRFRKNLATALCVLVKTKEPKIEWRIATREADQMIRYFADKQLRPRFVLRSVN